MEVEVARYDCSVLREDVVVFSQPVEDALVATGSVVVYIYYCDRGLVELVDVEDLNISVFNEIGPQGDTKVRSGPVVC